MSATSHDTEFVEKILGMALWQRRHVPESRKSPIQATVDPSDVGAEYTSQRYTRTLTDEGLVPTISSIGVAFDNAAAETVRGFFKHEATARDSPFLTGVLAAKTEVENVVVEWVHWYNKVRLRSPLGYRTPMDLEELYYD